MDNGAAERPAPQQDPVIAHVQEARQLDLDVEHIDRAIEKAEARLKELQARRIELLDDAVEAWNAAHKSITACGSPAIQRSLFGRLTSAPITAESITSQW